MGLPTSGKPTAKDVVEWASDLARRGRGVDVDGYYGMQCWDLPNYILKRYWGFTTWGNANAMAIKSNYRGYDFKIYRNTPSFVPLPGDWAVWAGSNPGHVAIVVGPSSTSKFVSIDQNWYTANWTGSIAQKITHNYNGVTHFVRPPYKKAPVVVNEPTKPTPTAPSKPVLTEEEKVQLEKAEPSKPEVRFKEVTEIVYTTKRDDFGTPDRFEHFVAWGQRRTGAVKGITIRNAHSMRSVSDLYNDRNKYINSSDYPHYYIDRLAIWQPRPNDYEYPNDPNNIVIEVCGDYSDDKEGFVLNELWAMIIGATLLEEYKIDLNFKNIKVDNRMWRSLKEHVNWDFIKDGFPPKEKLEELAKSAVGLYSNKDNLLVNKAEYKVTKSKIKTVVNNKNKDVVAQNEAAKETTSTSKPIVKTTPSTPKIVIEKSRYTFGQALDRQMRVAPQINIGWGWYHANRTQTSNAMNPTNIWNSTVQRYQMLNLGKYQGIPVSKLNQLLSNKGTLSGQGKAFADGCKRYQVNEIYLIAHALLESGHGKSNFASGRYGVYNYFGIGAFDSNPNNAITFARNEGWTTPAKAIIGGAKFVREGYIDKGQNTLYRMRWNPKNPATHQYATDINWCKHQATTIHNYYKLIKTSGMFYVRDQYR